VLDLGQVPSVDVAAPIIGEWGSAQAEGRLVEGGRAAPGGFQSVSTGRVSGQVVSQFLDMVKRGELNAGDRLPPERELAERFGVGRNSVREALRELNLLGVVASRHGEGTFVAAPDARHLMTPFRSLLELSAPAADSVLEFRLVFEPSVAGLAARNLTTAAEVSLRDALATFEAAVSERQSDAERADTAFHFAIARATDNPMVIAVHQALLELLTDFRSKLSRDAYHPQHRVAVGHREIFDAIVSRDEQRAQRTMHDHLVDVSGGLTPAR
jgi:GntR family transcriptional regulator, transcriptional repressor for pyruvate dehydrogenase complex